MYMITLETGKEILLPELSNQELDQIISLIGTIDGNKFLTLRGQESTILCGFVPNKIISLVKVVSEIKEGD